MNNITQQPATNDLRHTISTKDADGNPMTIKIRLNDECKNGHQDFAITGDIYQKGKPRIDKYFISVGCIHDEILKSAPELQLFVSLHLCDYKGIPMHAIRTLEEMTGKKFIVDSKRTQYNAPTREQIEEEKQKQASGYYTPEAKEQRANEEILKIEAKIDAEWENKVNEISIEYSLKKRVLHIGGKEALNNCIYHNHTKTLAFNWKGYDRISIELFNKIANEIILPEGVTIKNDNK